MVRTGARASALRALLEDAGYEFVAGPAPLRLNMLRAREQDEVRRLYSLLGGKRSPERFAPGRWDLTTKDSIAIELDEQFHFTRYRAMTLDSQHLVEAPWRSAYLGYCSAFESAAARGGGRWTSTSTERMFGPSDPVGYFGERGTARGKQRALYDAMKDLAAASGVVPLVRVSIYDVVAGASVNDILCGKASVSAGDLRSLLEARTYQRAPS